MQRETIQKPMKLVRPSKEDIARLAYSFWQARGCQGGSPEEDWFRAEREWYAGRAG
jgi:hypothetical protein